MALGTDEYKRFQLIDQFFASGKRATVKELTEYFERIMDQSDFDLSLLESGYGIGLRINSPLGPIKLDWGKGKQRSRFHFSFGGQF